LSWKRRTAT